MKILLFNLILLINFVFISNSVAANKNNLAKVGDYIIAEISSQANDYDTANPVSYTHLTLPTTPYV